MAFQLRMAWDHEAWQRARLPALPVPAHLDDHARDQRFDVLRVSWWWHTPQVLPSRIEVNKALEIYITKGGHELADLICDGRPGVLLAYTAEQWDVADSAGALRLPPCLWCGTPTKRCCPGMPPNRAHQRQGFICYKPLCNACHSLINACPCCVLWVGMPVVPASGFRQDRMALAFHQYPGATTCWLLGSYTRVPQCHLPRCHAAAMEAARKMGVMDA